MSGFPLVSVLTNRCPSCHKGKFFETSWYNIRSFTKMHKRCPHCNVDFRQEPGFYFGAAYVSYIIQIILFMLLYILFEWKLEFPFWTYVVMVIIIQLLLMPVIFRVSRITWFALFGKYPE